MNEPRTEPTALPLPPPRPGVIEDRMALLALACVHREYPNKVSHVLASDADARPPRELFPVFHGCFDWHSSVHGHWLLTRILKTDPDSPLRDTIVRALAESFRPEKVAGEVAYLAGDGRASFERPYGLAWFLQLVAELAESEAAELRGWRQTLGPLEEAVVERVKSWVPKLAYPIRLGTHNQSAFGFSLMLDYARTVGDEELEQLLVDKALAFHAGDVACPLAYEPSGEDFLSPCLQEADLMRRVLGHQAFSEWLTRFLPEIPEDGSADWLAPGVVTDPTDGKLVHLDGVNLSRAWNMQGIAAALPAGDPRVAALLACSGLHRERGVAAISSENYEGSHWLGSFAIYLATGRGVTGAGAP